MNYILTDEAIKEWNRIEKELNKKRDEELKQTNKVSIMISIIKKYDDMKHDISPITYDLINSISAKEYIDG